MIRSLVIPLTLERDRREIGLQRKQPTRRLKREKRAGNARERLRRGNTFDGHVVEFPGAKFKGQRKCKTRYLDTERTALAPSQPFAIAREKLAPRYPRVCLVVLQVMHIDGFWRFTCSPRPLRAFQTDVSPERRAVGARVGCTNFQRICRANSTASSCNLRTRVIGAWSSFYSFLVCLFVCLFDLSSY